MSRIAQIALALVVVLLAVASGATAAKTKHLDWALQGSAVWDPATQPGNFEVHTFSAHGSLPGVGSYSGALTAGTYTTTAECGPECAPITGTLTFVTQQGNLTTTVDAGGFVSVTVIGSGTYYNFTLRLTVTDGTKSYSHASGHFSVLYSSFLQNDDYLLGCDPSPCTVQDAGTLTGDFTRGDGG